MELSSNISGTARAPHLHQPERGESESFAEYRERRARSNAAAKRTAGQCLNGGTNSRETFRNSMRANGTMGKRIRASDALMAAWASKRVPKWEGQRDEHGTYTLVGRGMSATHPSDMHHGRRIWLAGISAQRGY